MSRSLALACALFALACGGEKAAAPTTAAADDTGAVEDAVDETPTPEVCGNAVGDVFCDHALMGYVRVGETTGLASSAAYGAHKLTDVLSKSTVKYVYVFASAYW